MLKSEENERKRRQTALAIESRRTLIERWEGDDVKRYPKWEARAKLAAELLEPGCRVADVGCGGMTMETLLPPGAVYVPFDVCRRDDRTNVIDLNSEPFPIVNVDAILCLGVLEYLFDPLAFIHEARKSNCLLIFSYHPIDFGEPTDRRVKNWVSDLSLPSILSACFAAGYRQVNVKPSLPKEYLFSAKC